MLKIIDTQQEKDPNVFGEILREAFFEESSSYISMTLKEGFVELDKNSEDGRKVLSILGLIIDYPLSILDSDIYWKNIDTQNSVYLSKAKVFKGPLESYVGWCWDGSGCGTVVVGEKDRFAVNTDCRLDNNWRWCKP